MGPIWLEARGGVRIQGLVIIEPLSAPKADTITIAATTEAPTAPNTLVAVSAATSFEPTISGTVSTYRYARLTTM